MAGAKKHPNGTRVLAVIFIPRAARTAIMTSAAKAAISTAQAIAIQSSHTPATAASLTSPNPMPSRQRSRL
jgi:hypothetical protein